MANKKQAFKIRTHLTGPPYGKPYYWYIPSQDQSKNLDHGTILHLLDQVFLYSTESP